MTDVALAKWSGSPYQIVILFVSISEECAWVNALERGIIKLILYDATFWFPFAAYILFRALRFSFLFPMLCLITDFICD